MQTAESEATSITDVDDIAAEMAEQASPPNEGAIAAAQASFDALPAVRTITVSEGNQTQDNPRDSKGNEFDPAVHHANDDGTPKLYNGKLRRKRSKSTESTISTLGVPADPRQSLTGDTSQLSSEQIKRARVAGKMCADVFIDSAQMVGGAEFTPIVMTHETYGKIDERANLQEKFGDYFVAKGVQDFPPGVALGLAMFSFVVARFAMPQTKTRVQKVREWIFAKIGSWRGKRAARANSGNVRERENDASNATSGSGTELRA